MIKVEGKEKGYRREYMLHQDTHKAQCTTLVSAHCCWS